MGNYSYKAKLLQTQFFKNIPCFCPPSHETLTAWFSRREVIWVSLWEGLPGQNFSNLTPSLTVLCSNCLLYPFSVTLGHCSKLTECLEEKNESSCYLTLNTKIQLLGDLCHKNLSYGLDATVYSLSLLSSNLPCTSRPCLNCQYSLT